MLDSINPGLFSQKETTRIALLFGPSPSRPCEVYDVCSVAATDEEGALLLRALMGHSKLEVQQSQRIGRHFIGLLFCCSLWQVRN